MSFSYKQRTLIIELNPVRAKIVSQPSEYRWSSYRVNMGIKKSDLMTHHEIYLQLGCSDEARFDAYKALFDEELNYLQLESIRAATNRGLLVGSEKFKNEIEELLGQSVRPDPVGRSKGVDEAVAV